jgi:hypothetical protein
LTWRLSRQDLERSALTTKQSKIHALILVADDSYRTDKTYLRGQVFLSILLTRLESEIQVLLPPALGLKRQKALIIPSERRYCHPALVMLFTMSENEKSLGVVQHIRAE